MPSCVMRFCTNYSKKASKSQGITYHSFPSNELRRIQWVDIVRLQRSEESWQPHSDSRICSVHFKDEDKYISAKGSTLLKKSALPSPGLPHSTQSTPRPNSLDGEKVSDLESILESPREKMPLTPAEKQKRYREKMKLENPDKYEERKKKASERNKRYYREKASQYTEEEKEKRRQHWRDSNRRKTSPSEKQMPLTPVGRQKIYPDEEYKKRIDANSIHYYREKAKQYTEYEKEKNQQWRDARKLSTTENQDICKISEIYNSDKYEQMMERAENSKCCNEKENTLTQTTKKEVKKLARRKLTPAERQKRYRDKLKRENPDKYLEIKKNTADRARQYYRNKLKGENPDKYLEIKKNTADHSRQYYREQVSSNVEEQWNDVRRIRLSPRERMKRYREKLKRENPAKYLENLKSSAENARRHYRKKAEQYTEEEKEARRQNWREARRINKRKRNKIKKYKKNTRKYSEESSSEEDAEPGPSEIPITLPWHIPDSSGVSDTSAQDPLRKQTDQCRFCGEFSSDCFVVSSHMPYLAGHRATLALNDTSIHLDFNDGLPKTVCRYCDTKLQEISDFIKTVKDAQDSMHGKIKSEKEDMREIDIVIKTETESTDGDSISISDTVFVKTVSNKRKSDITTKAKITEPNESSDGDSMSISDTVFVKSVSNKRKSDITKRAKVTKPNESSVGDSMSISDTVSVKTVTNKGKSDMIKKANVAKPNVMVECENEFLIDVKQEIIDNDTESSRHSGVDSDTLSVPDELKGADAYFCETTEETVVTEVIKKEKD